MSGSEMDAEVCTHEGSDSWTGSRASHHTHEKGDIAEYRPRVEPGEGQVPEHRQHHVDAGGVRSSERNMQTNRRRHRQRDCVLTTPPPEK